eukprot:TRINITY_DN13170_c0_g1_i1.p1 TRINITY_DN13170_c0_g1~~TRINITY_DN13170_c0_g1_i1.p1  ORF type:complete len:212 (-),score=47.60 TRINITY_DN13170_c0_g1_i1:161-796(-)
MNMSLNYVKERLLNSKANYLLANTKDTTARNITSLVHINHDTEEQYYELNRKHLEERFIGNKPTTNVSSPRKRLESEQASPVPKIKSSNSFIYPKKKIRFNNSIIKNVLSSTESLDKSIDRNTSLLLNYLRDNYTKQSCLPPIKGKDFSPEIQRPHHFRIHSLLDIRKPYADVNGLKELKGRKSLHEYVKNEKRIEEKRINIYILKSILKR